MKNLKSIKSVADELNNDIDEVTKKLKSIQSMKCRFKNQKARVDYEEKMEEILKEEQILKEVRSYLLPKRTTFVSMNKDEVSKLTYEETLRALKSVQSKKCLSYNKIDKTEYNKACEQEDLLKEHRSKVSPVEENLIRKTSILTLIETIESLDNKEVTKEMILERLKELV